MKKILPVLLLMTGFIVGWGTASVVAYRNIQKIRQTWSPEFQKLVAENVEFAKGLTRADLEQLRKDIRDYSSHAMKEGDIKTLWQAILARQIEAALAKGDTNRVHELLAGCFTELKEAREKGRFKGPDWENVVDTLVSKMEERTNSPTTGRTVPPEAAAPGVQ